MRPAPLALALALSFLTPATADHCTTWSTTTQGDLGPMIEVAGRYAFLECYIASVNGCRYTIWIYEETNGIPGLQREDEVKDDTCHGTIPGDTAVF